MVFQLIVRSDQLIEIIDGPPINWINCRERHGSAVSTGLLPLLSRHTVNVEQTEDVHADGEQSVDTLVIEVAT